jgi:hypothetical protein
MFTLLEPVMRPDRCMSKKNCVSVIELKSLLFSVRDLRPDIYVRFRFLGEMWQTTHSRIIRMDDNGGVFCDVHTTQLYAVQDLNNVIQFEIDQSFQDFEPHFHYTIQSVVINQRA